ncbi:MAG: phage head morphogenesis protein [Burkholderiaceae bacterium]|nr:MAG: phage head morphogenesis protein [Burkholderiaceae bacterium]
MAKPDDQDVLGALFNRPPKDAIEYLKSKGLRITFKWQEMLDEAHARAFTVAKAMNLDVLRDIRSDLLDALKEGKTLRDFSKELAPKLQQKGWWGKQIVVAGDGQAQEVQLGGLRRLKTIYQTNLQSAYMAGRAKAIAESSGAFPWLMYVAVMDNRTRPAHAALNGKIWPKNDPIWQSIFPPNGFNCRCRTRPLTAGQMKREGLAPSPPPDVVTRTVNAGTDPLTGELFPTMQTGVRVTSEDGQPITMWTDPGFNASPMAGHAFDELLARKAVAALGDEAGFNATRDVILSEPRVKAWEAFTEGAFEPGFRTSRGEVPVQNQSMTVGILPLEAARDLIGRGTPVMPVLHVDDRLIAGRKARRHTAEGNALSAEQWQALPELLKGATYYLDKDSGNVLAVVDAGINRVLKVAFSATGAADTAFIVPAVSVEAAVGSGRWELLSNGRGT